MRHDRGVAAIPDLGHTLAFKRDGRALLDSSGNISSADLGEDPVYAELAFETDSGNVKCSAVACRLPSGEPCVPCAKQSGDACLASYECASHVCKARKCQ
jgi:hypothetical protein